ncbi:glycosyltransferase family 4 protein [Cellulophaga sp. Hel_I_12]|uniref:glycosyltransferase family 4 protein n=1 Tax=Cellulophaga sp. Hel_I_12 TaxID=1249972 RepID=UPI000645C88A|nr:glycosyltransferase family 4 protein [Cellulophaga sp. Hel_I_12]
MKKIIRVTTIPASLYTLLRGQLQFMNSYFEMVGIASDDVLLNEVHKTQKVRVIPVEMTRKITPLKDLRAVFTLYKIFKKEKPFIIHSHTPKAGTVSMIAAKLAGVPNRLHTIAGLPLVEARGFKRILLNTVEKITYACATKIYPNSHGLQEIILKNKFTHAGKMKIIGNGSSNGIDVADFDPSKYTAESKATLRNSLRLKENDIVFIFVGRLVKDKGINELIASFTKLNARYNQAKLLLVGRYEKELDPVLPETEDAITTSPNIVLVGWQQDVRPFFSIANVLTFPSYREGFPNVVMQAGAMGLYSIVSDINGCNEIIIEGENGSIIAPKKEEALYEKMKLICEDKIKIDPERNRQLIIDRYEQNFVWHEILKEYQSLEITK